MSADPKELYGRALEGAHATGFHFERTCAHIENLLEGDGWKTVGIGFEKVNDFIRSIRFDPADLVTVAERRKRIAKRIKELQPQASNRAIADALGVGRRTIDRDVGPNGPRKQPIEIEETPKEETSGPSGPHKLSGAETAKHARKQEEKNEKQAERTAELDAQRVAISQEKVQTVAGPFGVIVIDPPWPYGTKYDATGRRSANPYPEMSLDEIAADGDTEVVAKALPDCVLWLWTTHRFMRHCPALLDRWGFDGKVILTWVKDRMGTGQWLRSQSEFCIFAVRGKPLITLSNQTTVLNAPLREHSRKPDEFYALVESLCPDGRRYDRFAREQRAGWLVGGNDTEKF